MAPPRRGVLVVLTRLARSPCAAPGRTPPPRRRRTRAGAAAQVRRHQGLLRRLRPQLPGRRAAQAAHRARHLLVKKPGKMRWDYTAPESKLFVSDGVKIYSYIPAGQAGDRRDGAARRSGADADAVPGRQGQPRRATSPPSIVDAPAGMPAGTRALKLVPEERSNRTTIGWCSSSTRHAWQIRGLRHGRRAGRDVEFPSRT